MTVRSVSWTDAEQVKSLLARVGAEKPQGRPSAVRQMGSPRATGAVRQGISFGSVSRPAPQVAPKAAAPNAAVTPPAPPAKAAPAPLAPLPTIDATNPSDRLDALLLWTLDNTPCSGAFVADDNGLTLAAHGISEAHVSIVGPLLSSLVGIRTVPGIDATSGALWLGAQMMSWVEVQTDRGGFCLGTLGDEALTPRILEHLKEALALTVQGL